MYLFHASHEGINYTHSYDKAADPRLFHLHTHESAELYYFIAGKGTYHVEGSAYPLSPGDVLLMRPTEGHYIEIDGSVPYERITVNFPLDFFHAVDTEGLLEAPFINRKSGTLNRYARSLFSNDLTETIFKVIEQKDDALILKTRLMMLLAEVSEVFRAGAVTETPNVTLEYRIIRYLNSHLHQRITIRSLSERYYMSPSQLDRRFKRATGTTIADYLNTKRMLMARRLLESGHRATDVSQLCGFTDYSAFYRAYRKKFKKAPGGRADAPEQQS